MKPSSFLLNINSSNPQRLYDFYHDKLGLEVNPGSGEGALWAGPGATLIFDTHSQVSGRNDSPARHLVNLFVDDIDAAQSEIEGRGVSFFRNKGLEWWGGIISTCEDPDGNYVQLIQYDPSKASAPPAPATA